MSRSKQDRAPKTALGMVPSRDSKHEVVQLTELKENTLVEFGGSKIPEFNKTLVIEVTRCLSVTGEEDGDASKRLIKAAGAALHAFKPADEIEGMIAAQAVGLHFTAMECLRRANIAEQPFEIAARLRKDAANLMRTMTDMLEALDRKRGKGPQVVRVERVVVHEGGQAIVGNVAPRGEG
jgi:hypothetical protein